MLGIGGGMVIIPFLTIVGDLPWQEAYSISLFSILSSSLWVSYQKIQRDLVEFDWAFCLESYGCLWAVLGSAVAMFSRGAYATEILLILLTFFALQNLWNLRYLKPPEAAALEPASPRARLAVSSVAGFSSGLLGIGGGMMIMALSPFMKLRMAVATATSSYAMGAITMGALMSSVVGGKMVWEYGVLAFMGTVVGSVLGVRLAQMISDRWLKMMMSWVLVIYALVMWYPFLK